MQSKKQTSLGYLMRLLDVSLRDLGDYIYVAQTSISKWKTGARALKPGSHHFDAIAEYFTLLTRDLDRRQRMEQLFARLYPDQPLDKPEAFYQCVRAFLAGSQLPPAEARHAQSESGRAYTAEVSIYSGAHALSSAFAMFAEYAAGHASAKIAAICLADCPEIFSSLLALLRQGHAARIVIGPQAANLLHSDTASVLAHPGAEIRLLAATTPYPACPSLILGDRSIALIARNRPGHEAYASIITDTLTTLQHCLDFDTFWQSAVPVFDNFSQDDLNAVLYRKALSTTLDEWFDWQTPSLPHMTMSEPLLMEVLQTNGVSGRPWSKLLAGHAVLGNMRMRLFLPAPALSIPPSQMPLLSALCGRPITLNAAQVKRHLLDTAALLRAGRLLIVPVRAEASGTPEVPCAFARRHGFSGFLDSQTGAVRVSCHPAMVTAQMSVFESIASTVTEMAQSVAYIAGRLERAALEAPPE